MHELGRQDKQFVGELVAFLDFGKNRKVLLRAQFDADDGVQLSLGFGVSVREMSDEPA